MEQTSERGASSWLTTIPLSEYGFTLHKLAFRDTLCLRYGWRPARLPSHCLCGEAFSLSHAFSCPRGTFPSIRHDQIRDLFAEFLTEVCPNVSSEPALQPISGETFSHRIANTDDGARLDVKEFLGDCSRSCAFFDIRAFNSHAPSNCKTTSAACYRRHEQEKRRMYKKKIGEVEHGSFTPIVLSSSGGWGPSATVAFKRLASLLSNPPFTRALLKWGEPGLNPLCTFHMGTAKWVHPSLDKWVRPTSTSGFDPLVKRVEREKTWRSVADYGAREKLARYWMPGARGGFRRSCWVLFETRYHSARLSRSCGR